MSFSQGKIIIMFGCLLSDAASSLRRDENHISWKPSSPAVMLLLLILKECPKQCNLALVQTLVNVAVLVQR